MKRLLHILPLRTCSHNREIEKSGGGICKEDTLVVLPPVYSRVIFYDIDYSKKSHRWLQCRVWIVAGRWTISTRPYKWNIILYQLSIRIPGENSQIHRSEFQFLIGICELLFACHPVAVCTIAQDKQPGIHNSTWHLLFEPTEWLSHWLKCKQKRSACRVEMKCHAINAMKVSPHECYNAI